ncbi:unnamed protein product [Symbiodinium sp. CCMP2592]|nr:unnamed protein product [Symbiodinium sp. CCMP2592]
MAKLTRPHTTATGQLSRQKTEPGLALGPISRSGALQHAAQSIIPTPVMVIYGPFSAKPATAPYGDRKLRTAGTMSKANLTDLEEEDALAKEAALKEQVSRSEAKEALDAAMAAQDTAQLEAAIELSRRAGTPSSRLVKAEFQLQKLYMQEMVERAAASHDAETLRSAVMRASRLGIDSATLAAAKKRLEVLTTEEMLRIAMRNNVTGHLQKCIDMAVFRKADDELIKQAQSLLEKSTAERALIAAMNSREVDKLTQAVEDAVSAGLPAADIEEAKQILAVEQEKAKERENIKEKPPKDEVEERLRTAINLQETGALLKAIKLAKRSDEAVRLNPEYAEGRSTHEESIKEAEHLVVILEVDMQLPRAIRSKDQQKLKAVLTKAKTWHIETEEVEQGEQLLSKIQADENLRLAIVSKSEEQLVAALEEANKSGAERQRILKAEAALALLRGLRELREAIESKDPDWMEQAIQQAKESGVPRTEISKAEGLLKSLTRSVPVSRVGSKFVEEDRPPLSRLGSKFVEVEPPMVA